MAPGDAEDQPGADTPASVGRASGLVRVAVGLAALVSVATAAVWPTVETQPVDSEVTRYLDENTAASPIGLLGPDEDGYDALDELVPVDRATVALDSIGALDEVRPEWLLVSDPLPTDADEALVDLVEERGEPVAADPGRGRLYQVSENDVHHALNEAER